MAVGRWPLAVGRWRDVFRRPARGSRCKLTTCHSNRPAKRLMTPPWWDRPVSELFAPLVGTGRAILPISQSPLEVAVSNLRLDDTRRARIERALTTLDARLRADATLGPLIRRLAKQGSFALGTAIRPEGAVSFDVDTALVMDVRRLPLRQIEPLAVANLVAEALSQHEWYRKRLSLKSRCIRIEYTGGFHVDVVPAHCDESYSPRSVPLLIANRPHNTWEESHPLGYQRWFSAADARTGRRLRQIVILMKRWRDIRPEDRAISSVLLTTLLCYAEDCQKLSLPRSVSSTLANLVNMLGRYEDVPVVANPSLTSENLSRDWSSQQFASFRRSLHDASVIAAEATRGGRGSRGLWRQLFGDAVPL